ncbi:MAG: hypothetical protein Q7T20_00330, partial [Saprospiraceae bacterium]|nr:hypothetical protein [Saprospiraceae bacterium]
KFEKENKWVNLNLVDGGNFIVKYHALRKEARDMVKSAKQNESFDKEKALEDFQKAYNLYSDLENLVESSRRGISQAKVTTWGRHSLKVIEVLIAAGIGGALHHWVISQ